MFVPSNNTGSTEKDHTMLQFSKLFGIRKTAIAALAIVAMLGALISINPASADYYPAYSADHLLTVEVDADEDGVTAVYIYEDYDAGERVWERGDADLDVVTSHGRIEIDKYSVGHVYERNAASGVSLRSPQRQRQLLHDLHGLRVPRWRDSGTAPPERECSAPST